MEYRRGECYWVAHNNYAEGSEMKKHRPAVIVSNNKNNEHSSVIEVVYMTDSRGPSLPTHVEVTKTSTGDLEGSIILCEQISSVGKHRAPDANSYICRLSDEDMEAVDNALLASLELEYKATCETKYIEVPKKFPKESPVKMEDTDKIIMAFAEGNTLVLDKIEQMLAAGPAPAQPASNELAMAKLEAEFYKQKYDELLERVMAKAKI